MTNDNKPFLAKVVEVDDVFAHPNADLLDIARVGGWQVVIKRGQFLKGDPAVYFQIDSWIPKKVAPFLQNPKKVRYYNNIEGERLRTIKLRGEYSQGLLIPVEDLFSYSFEHHPKLGEDVTEVLGIQKWEKQLPAQLRGIAKGAFPDWIRKTDQERIQNLSKNLDDILNSTFQVELKYDGSSMTIFKYNDEYGVASRNLVLKLEQEGNSFVDTAKASGLLDVLKNITEKNYAIQGELCGPKIQNNRHGLNNLTYFIFDIFDIDNQKYLVPEERNEFIKTYLSEIIGSSNGIVQIAKVIDPSFSPAKHEFVSINDFVSFVDGARNNENGNLIEGYVFKDVNKPFSFKAISNSYIFKYE